MVNLTMELTGSYTDSMQYKVSGDLEGNLDVEFKDEEFSGKIFLEDTTTSIRDWEEVYDEELFNFIKEQAIKDYNE